MLKKLLFDFTSSELQSEDECSIGYNKRVYTHLIRHCSFTHLLESGCDLSIIQKIAGHSNIKTTQGYTHISNNLISKINSPINNIRIYHKSEIAQESDRIIIYTSGQYRNVLLH